MPTTSSNVSYSNEIFKQYLFTISTGLVWKNMSKALANEKTDDAYLSEIFIVANRGLLNFEVVKAFPRAVLRNSGVAEENIEAYASDKRLIPINMRNTIVNEYVNALTSKNPNTGHYEYYDKYNNAYTIIYNENNNYYRMLMGLPNIGDTNYVYNTDIRWDTTTPIHNMSLIDRLQMETEGVLKTIQNNNPTKEYISYLGRKNIDFFTSRISERFELLYYTESQSDFLNDNFKTEYNKCKRLVNAVYYSPVYARSNELYENFLAMCILFMTLQSMQYKYLQVDITRDFYDTESLKLVYDSYGVPFYSEIPLEYHRKIVKNINRLISYKGSSQTFFDLFDIFDLGSMNIYSYFMTKTHKFDVDGKPLFIIKKDGEGNPMYDDEGNPIMDVSNYEIGFSKVKIYNDPALSVSDNSNNIEYSAITSRDPYWIEDENLQAKLAAESFNYTESKYIGIQTIFDLMKITYENAYIFRLITDNKDKTKTYTFRWLDAEVTCSIFDLLIYLSCLYCRFYGYEGIINTHIPAVATTLGYNFKDTLSILQNQVYTNSYLNANTQLKKLMLQMDMSNLETLNAVFSREDEIRKLIVAGYTESTSYAEFIAYRNLYNSLLVSKEVTATYTNPTTGSIFETFTDVLSYYSPDLMQRYLILQESNISEEMTLTINQLEKVMNTLRYLPFSAGVSSSAMIESLFKILTFFKSAKCDLIGYNITYTITMRGTEFFKMLDLVDSVISSYKGTDNANINDLLYKINDYINFLNSPDSICISDNLEKLEYYYKNHDDAATIDKFRKEDRELLLPYIDKSSYTDLINSINNIIKIQNKCANTDVLLEYNSDGQLVPVI